MKIPADTTCIIEFLIDAQFEESYEQMDYKIYHSSVNEDTLMDFEDVDLGEFMDLDEDGIFVVLDPGVYKFKVAYHAGTNSFAKLSQEKLPEDVAAACFSGGLDFLNEAEL